MQSQEKSITIPFIIGDGIGADIWKGTQQVVDQAVSRAYVQQRQVIWKEALAGEKSYQTCGEYLPQETIATLKKHHTAIKGPLTTPVGGGYTSLNVALRKELDLYSCIRPVKWFKGLPSPLKHPEKVDVVIFRENTEDLYAGIEFPSNSEGNTAFLSLLKEKYPQEYAKLRFKDEVGLAWKPISQKASQRIMRAAIQWAIAHHRQKISIVHKGNIMKYTEGAFRNWAYEVAEQEFVDVCFSNRTWKAICKDQGNNKADAEKEKALAQGKIYVDDVIADNAFAKAIIHPGKFDVVVTTNLNGDYLSDAFAALVGGIGISPGANINQETGWGLFEANHGSAEDIAGMDKANPSSLILSAAMMFDFLGWIEAAAMIRQGLERTIQSGVVTFDLHSQNPGSTLVGTSAFCTHVIKNMG